MGIIFLVWVYNLRPPNNDPHLVKGGTRYPALNLPVYRNFINPIIMSELKETVSLKDYCKAQGIVRVSNVLESKENKYPIVMLEPKSGEATCLMLSKNAGEKFPIGTAIKDVAKQMYVATFDHEEYGTVSRISTNSNGATVEELFD